MAPPIRAILFDAYGTLLDVHSVAILAEQKFPGFGAALSALWRDKQLQYTWLRTLAGRYEDFAAVTSASLDYALAALALQPSAADRSQLLKGVRAACRLCRCGACARSLVGEEHPPRRPLQRDAGDARERIWSCRSSPAVFGTDQRRCGAALQARACRLPDRLYSFRSRTGRAGAGLIEWLGHRWWRQLWVSHLLGQSRRRPGRAPWYCAHRNRPEPRRPAGLDCGAALATHRKSFGYAHRILRQIGRLQGHKSEAMVELQRAAIARIDLQVQPARSGARPAAARGYSWPACRCPATANVRQQVDMPMRRKRRQLFERVHARMVDRMSRPVAAAPLRSVLRGPRHPPLQRRIPAPSPAGVEARRVACAQDR